MNNNITNFSKILFIFNLKDFNIYILLKPIIGILFNPLELLKGSQMLSWIFYSPNEIGKHFISMAFNHSYTFYNLSCISTSLCGSLQVFLPLIVPPLRPLTCHSLLTNLSLTNQPLCKSFTLPFSHPADAFKTGIRNMRLTTL